MRYDFQRALSMLMDAYLIPFMMIVMMEFGDKTQLVVIAFSAANRRPTIIFFGAMLAFLLLNGVGVMMGQGLLQIIPSFIISRASGLVFIALGVYMLARSHRHGVMSLRGSRRLFTAAFTTILLAELGDKTQLSTIFLAARFNAPVEVLLGVFSALALVTGLGVVLGQKFAHRLNQKLIRVCVGVLFIVAGILMLLNLAPQ